MIRVFLADDHNLVRRALGHLLKRTDDIVIAGEAADGREAVRQVLKLRPDVVVMDITMPNLNGSEATRKIVAEAPDVRVLALSAHVDRRSVAQMLEAGASGFLAKDCEADELLRAIRNVAQGKSFLGSDVADVVIQDYVPRLAREGDPPSQKLTAREREVLQLLAEGKSSKEIAALLDLSSKTIDNHRANIMARLGLNSVAELTKYAIREGLTSIDF